MRLIRLLVSASLPTFLAAIGAGIAGGIGLTLTIALVNRILTASTWTHTGGPAMAAVAAAVITGVASLSYLSATTVSTLMQRSLADLRMALCQRIMGAQLAQLEAKGQSSLVALFSDDLGKVAQGAFALPVLVVNASVCVAACVYLAGLHPALFGILIATQAATICVTAACFGRFMQAARAALEERHVLMANYHLLTGSIKEFKQSAARRDAFMCDLFMPNVQRAMRTGQHVNQLGNSMDAIAKAGFLLTIAALVVAAHAFPGLATSSELQAVVVGFIFMATPLAAAVNGAPQLLEANTALQRVEALALAPEPAGTGIDAAAGSVGLVDACFSYGVRQTGYDSGPVSLTLRRGEIVSLSGSNGSGKTTVARCLAGLYTLACGRLAVNDQPVAATAMPAYRELFSVVWSDGPPCKCYLPPAAHDAGRTAWRALGLDQVAPFACGWFDCGAMSTGQRHRVALVAAIMDARPFIILDEWSANQDKQFRELFYSEILPALRAGGHGVLVIAHDAGGVPGVDRILRMQDGVLLAEAPVPACPLATTHTTFCRSEETT